MIAIRLLAAVIAGAICSLFNGESGVWRGILLFLGLTAGLPLAERFDRAGTNALCGAVIGLLTAIVLVFLPEGKIPQAAIQTFILCIIYGTGFYWAEYLTVYEHFTDGVYLVLVTAMIAQLIRWSPLLGSDDAPCLAFFCFAVGLNGGMVAGGWWLTMLCRDRSRKLFGGK